MTTSFCIHVISDLHLEAPAAYDIYEIAPSAPYLALLGDIGYIKDEGFFEFLDAQLLKFRIVFFIYGNHEPYHSNWTAVKEKVEAFKARIGQARHVDQKYGEFVVLDQTAYNLSEDLTILGCTLHSRILPEQSDHVSFGLNDFYYIEDWTVEQHTEAHLADLAWLNSQVEALSKAEPGRKIVILTHHCPSTDEQTQDPKFRGSKISSAFSTDLSSEPCWTSSNVKLWMFGHTHFNCDFVDEKTGKRVATNQRGYYFQQSGGYSAEGYVEL